MEERCSLVLFFSMLSPAWKWILMYFSFKSWLPYGCDTDQDYVQRRPFFQSSFAISSGLHISWKHELFSMINQITEDYRVRSRAVPTTIKILPHPVSELNEWQSETRWQLPRLPFLCTGLNSWCQLVAIFYWELSHNYCVTLPIFSLRFDSTPSCFSTF